MAEDADGFVTLNPELSAGFEWFPTYDELLQQIAITNQVDADWPILKDMLKYKLSENIASYLALGPPWPISPEEAHNARNRAYEALDTFQGPPFTIQRICELILTPRKHYTSLHKYLRALTRAVTVSSDRSSFLEDDTIDFNYASTSSVTMDPSNSYPSNPSSSPGSSNNRNGQQARFVNSTGAVLPTRRPAAARSPASSPKALPVVVPLLSPIPWLIRSDSDMEGEEEYALDGREAHLDSSHFDAHPLSETRGEVLFAEDNHSLSMRTEKKGLSPPSGDRHLVNELNNTSAEFPNAISHQLSHSSPPKQFSTTTPTGGLVDEVDPGSGGQETASPISLTQSASTPASTSTLNHLHLSPPTKNSGELLDVTSLSERFTRASSPRVDVDEGND